MHFTHLAVLGQVLTLTTAHPHPPPRAASSASASVSASNASSSSFTLSAVDLTTGSNTLTPLTIVESLASRRILRPASSSTSTSATQQQQQQQQQQFTYNATSRRLENAAFGASDPVIANRTLTFGEFAEPADGRLVQKKQGGGGGGGGGMYFVFADDADGRTDGWSLCASEFAGLFWSGDQAPLANCTKVALQAR